MAEHYYEINLDLINALLERATPRGAFSLGVVVSLLVCDRITPDEALLRAATTCQSQDAAEELYADWRARRQSGEQP